MTTETATQPDQAKVEQFVERALSDFSATLTTLLCALGDRLGLFHELATKGPATPAELAERARVSERYAAEWSRGLAAAGYLARDGDDGRYVLPAEHAPVLAHEAGPMFLGGGYQLVPPLAGQVERLAEVFRTGGGVAQEAYGADLWDGMQRFTGTWFENLLLGEWLPACPHLERKLERGCSVADVGCGAGRAVLELAHAYPRSRFVGFDNFEAQIERARENAEREGVADRVRFELLDAAEGLPGRYDIVTTFDVIHDAVDPRGLLRAIRAAVEDDGSYVMLEINCADRHEDNAGPLAAMFYGFSVFYCMTTSLAHGGEGLGTCGMPEAKVRELCAEAGFGTVERVPIENPFNALYEIRP
jgi:2-polyprenyl-3-methyl-5-hydroxy-6-metoxy-1,4-benzoquinol methylase